MQRNKKIIMNPPTVRCHLAGFLTRGIRFNEPPLIFTRDGGNWLSPTDSAPLFISPTCQFWNQHERVRVASYGSKRAAGRAEHEKRGSGEGWGVEGGGGGSQGGRGRHVWATIKERRAAAELICLLARCHCCANCSVDPASPLCQMERL